MTEHDRLFARRGAAPADRSEQNRRRQTVREAVSRLCSNEDFKTWLYATLDDLRLFDRDEAPVDDFGQGFRAAAARIRDRLLDAPEAVDMLASMYRIDLVRSHRAITQPETK